MADQPSSSSNGDQIRLTDREILEKILSLQEATLLNQTDIDEKISSNGTCLTDILESVNDSQSNTRKKPKTITTDEPSPDPPREISAESKQLEIFN